MKALHTSAVALAVIGGSAAAIAGTLLLAPHASAAPRGVDAYAYENTVLLSEIADELDIIPTCAMEDGSDVVPAIAPRCVWVNDGASWLTYEDRSYRIIMDTVRYEDEPGWDCATMGNHICG